MSVQITKAKLPSEAFSPEPKREVKDEPQQNIEKVIPIISES